MSNNSPSFGPNKLSDSSGDSWQQRINGIAKGSDDAGVTFYELIAQETIMRQARGILAETVPYNSNLASPGTMVSGTVYYTAIPLLKGMVVNNLVLMITGAGSGMTGSKLGICDVNGNRLAVTADLGTLWQTIGNRVAPLTAPFTVPASGLYYFAAWATTGTTMPVCCRGGGGTVIDGSAIGSGAKLFGSMTGQSDIPPSGVITAAVAATNFLMWGAATA